MSPLNSSEISKQLPSGAPSEEQGPTLAPFEDVYVGLATSPSGKFPRRLLTYPSADHSS